MPCLMAVTVVMVGFSMAVLGASLNRSAATLSVPACVATIQKACICLVAQTTGLASLLAHSLGMSVCTVIRGVVA